MGTGTESAHNGLVMVSRYVSRSDDGFQLLTTTPSSLYGLVGRRRLLFHFHVHVTTKIPVLQAGKHNTQDKTRPRQDQDKTRQDKTRQDNTQTQDKKDKKDKTRQGKTTQDTTRQHKTTQDDTTRHNTTQHNTNTTATFRIRVRVID